ncbi:MAG: ADYC domain-containing protein [Tahibacter sp.]
MLRLLLGLLGCALAAVAIADNPVSHGLSVDGTSFVLDQADGRVLRSRDLIGAELDLEDGSTVRIDAVRADPGDPSGETLLHRFSVRVGDSDWQNPCEANYQGEQEGFPLSGRWDAEGRFHADPAHFVLSCTSGAQAKCVRFGYKPWKNAPDGAALAPLYEACVHMVRADYCGNGEASTKNGTQIDVYDAHGVQHAETAADFHFEAGWSPHGAVCVARTRIVENLSLQQLAQGCPRLREAVGESCTEQRASELGAVVFNRSR